MTRKTIKSSQLYFFLMPEEMFRVLKFAQEQGNVILLPRSSGHTPAVCEDFRKLGQAYCCPSDLVSEVKTHKVVDKVYALDPTVSPVVEIECSILREKALSCGRLYFRAGFDGREGWIPFPEAVKNCFSDLSFFLKKMLTQERQFNARLSYGAKDYVEKGGILSQF